MGNQNTSGTVEEVEAKNEAQDNAQGAISPPDAVTVENQTLFILENAAEAEGDIIPHVERAASDDKEIEDHKGSVEGSDAEIGMSTNGSDLGEGRSKMSDEEQDQPCTLTEEMENPSPKCTTHQAVNTTDIQQEQNKLEETPEADDHDAGKNDDDLAYVEGTFLEALGSDDEPPQEEQSNSIDTINEDPTNSLLDSSTAENEHKNECSPLDHEEKAKIHEFVNGVDQDQPSDQEINHFLIRCSTDPMEVINGDDLLEDAEKQEDIINEATDQNMLEKVLHCESEPSAAENETETTEKYVIELQSSLEINTAEDETPPISKDSESEACADVKLLDAEANPSYAGAQVELRKSPSFDFGISFDTRSEESDQTPLLYQDKTARRSLSTCSNLRFQNTNVQTEYVRKPLQFEAVQVEEKTILMERSNSKTPPSQLMNSSNNKKEINGSSSNNASPSRDDAAAAAAISPTGNGRRKARSSLFTTCICCTAAIS